MPFLDKGDSSQGKNQVFNFFYFFLKIGAKEINYKFSFRNVIF